VVVDDNNESEESSTSSSSYHFSDHYYCPSDDDEYSTSDDDDSSVDSDMPGLQSRVAELSSSDDEETITSNADANADKDGNEDSIQGSILSNSTNEFPMNDDIVPNNGFALDAFNDQNTIPSPLHVMPPVSCVIVPNDSNDVNSSTAAPVNERVDPTGRVPIRIQEDCFAHVDDIICHKPALMNIGGDPIHNWAQFVDTRRSFPTQVSINHQIALDMLFSRESLIFLGINGLDILSNPKLK
jgi:hypothetical protein